MVARKATLSVLIRRCPDSLFLKISDERIQMLSVNCAEPTLFAKYPDKLRTQRIIHADKEPSRRMLPQHGIPESPERPYFRTVVGAIDTGRHITAVTTGMTVIAGHAVIITVPYFLPVAVVMIQVTQGRPVGVPLIASFFIIMIVAAKEAFGRIPRLLSVGIILDVIAQGISFRMTDLVALGIVMILSAQKKRSLWPLSVTVSTLYSEHSGSSKRRLVFRSQLHIQSQIVYLNRCIR